MAALELVEMGPNAQQHVNQCALHLAACKHALFLASGRCLCGFCPRATMSSGLLCSEPAALAVDIGQNLIWLPLGQEADFFIGWPWLIWPSALQ